MAMLLIEGFDQYDDDSEILRGGWYTSGLTSLNSLASPIHGPTGRSINLLFNNINLGHLLRVPSTATYTFGFAVNLNGGGPRTGYLARMRVKGLVQNEVRLDGTGEITIRRATTDIATSSGAGLAQGQWSYVEVTIFLHASTGTVDVWVNGQNVLSDTGLNTLGQADAWIDAIEVLGDTVYDPVFDDIYVLDDSGSDNTSQLGEVFVETLLPDADGNVNDWTRFGGGSNNFEAVDDMAPPDDDTTYVHSATATDQDLYGMAALTSSVGTVFAVEVSALVRKEDAGFREIRLVARSNVTEAESGNISFSASNYRYMNHIFENDPDGGVDWDEASVNAAEFGIVLET